MVLQHLQQLARCHIVLASASPRRQELLRNLGLYDIAVIPSTFEENLDKSLFSTAGAYAEATAQHKAIEVATRLSNAGHDGSAYKRSPDLVIAADTVVELAGEVMEKPQNEQDAFSMLQNLSGQRHRVFSGTALVLPQCPDPQLQGSHLMISFNEETIVEFGELSDEEILAYIATGDPMDKAGSYGIQGIGATLVRRIEGCYFNVMGLPIHRLATELDNLILNGKLRLPSLTSTKLSQENAT